MSLGPRTQFKRLGRRVPTNVVEIYPSPSGGDCARGLHSTRDGRVPQEDREPRAIRCYQCGQPIEDSSEVENCPLCGSDNVTGKRY